MLFSDFTRYAQLRYFPSCDVALLLLDPVVYFILY